MKTKCFFPLLFLVFLLIGCRQADLAGMSATATAMAVEGDTTPTPRPTRPAQNGTTVLADGQLVAVNPVLALGFNSNGRLLELHVQPGDKVAEGDPIATLDDTNLREAVTNAELQVAQAEISLNQARLTLDDLENWEPDGTAVSLAEANLTAAQTALENAQTADASAGNGLTSARINLEQAERNLADSQKAYETAFDPGREWETFMTDPSCLPGQDGTFVPCTGVPLRDKIEAERDGATRGLQYAEENLEVAKAQYNLALAGLNNDTAVSAQAGVISAQQALEQATTGPKEKDIAAARLNVEQAELSLQQSQIALEQAEDALAEAQLTAPWDGTVLTVEAAVGAFVGAGTPVVTLLDTANLQFHTSNLSERDLAQVEPGNPVEITLKTYPSQPVQGVVQRIAPQAGGVVGDAAVFTVMIDLTETAALDLRPGMTGRAEITNNK
ncbi:MAG: HlyD family efflux transporter periplasmic adaptor subunit [Ardenticatenaceae bacterium]|nr:HlyD family efflux transporter periplasmic adaptor subunit [Ardenticatenaceae bacterium]MCB9446128.1 HlyD family efflux transporter periplasmic adaptor subunit [Ardenticatenaceae bacterium]